MIFIDNKYTRIYYCIINNARQRNSIRKPGIEQHHIIPKCLLGNNTDENLVMLTAREHFVCHWLLTKMVIGEERKKMIFALNRMLTSTKTQHRIKITGRKFELIKGLAYKNNPFNNTEWQLTYGGKSRKGVLKSDKAKLNMSLNHADVSGSKNPMYGKTHTKETITKISIALKGKMVGEKNGFYGKSHSSDVCKKLSVNAKKQNSLVKHRIYASCIYCKKELDLGNFNKSHGSKCKFI